MVDRCLGRRFGCITLSLAALLLAGCSGERQPEVDYALPDTLCGAGIGKGAVKPFFPPGGRLEKSGDDLVNGKYSSGCTYAVDGSPVLVVSNNFHDDKTTARQIATKRAASHGNGNAKVAVDADSAIALYSRGVVAVHLCSGYPSDGDGLPRTSFSVEIQAYYPKDLSKVGQELTRLVENIVPAVVKANGC